MHIVTEHALFATAAPTAAGLFGSLAFRASTQADGTAWVNTASGTTMGNILGDMGLGAFDP